MPAIVVAQTSSCRVSLSAPGKQRQGRARSVTVRAGKKPEDRNESFTVGGGGYGGACDISTIKEAIEACKDLTGERQKACWAQFGCSIEDVTGHYASLAKKVDGVEVKPKTAK